MSWRLVIANVQPEQAGPVRNINHPTCSFLWLGLLASGGRCGRFIQARGRGSNGVFVSESCSPPSLLSRSSSSGLDRQLQRPQRRLHRCEWTFDPFFDPSLVPVFTQFVFFLLDWSGREGDPAHHASQQRRCGRPDPRGRGHQPHPGCWLVHGRPQVGSGRQVAL